MDRTRYSVIAHSGCEFAAPCSFERADSLLKALPVGDLLDVGCGFGAWTSIAADFGFNAVGIDRNEAFIERAREGPTEATFVIGEAMEIGVHPCDAMLCVGSTHALGGLEATLAFARAKLRPGGRLLIGEGFWASPPSPEYLAFLECETSDMSTHLGNVERIRAAGGEVWLAQLASREEWEDYESDYRLSMLKWLEANAADLDAAEFREHCNRWYEGYLRWGYETLGFGFYVVGF